MRSWHQTLPFDQEVKGVTPGVDSFNPAGRDLVDLGVGAIPDDPRQDGKIRIPAYPEPPAALSATGVRARFRKRIAFH